MKAWSKSKKEIENKKSAFWKVFAILFGVLERRMLLRKKYFLKEVRKRNEGESAQKRHSTKQMCTLVDRRRSSK